MKSKLALAIFLSISPAIAADLQPFGRGSWQDLRETHAGTPKVVHMWGLTCAPCLVEMPHWGALLREHDGFKLVMIAADPVAQDPARLTATLDAAGLTDADNWVFADDFGDRLRYEIDPRWRGELPRTLLIDGNGAVTTLPGVVDMKIITDWIAAQK